MIPVTKWRLPDGRIIEADWPVGPIVTDLRDKVADPHRRWKVQAFLMAWYTGAEDDYPYPPTFHRTKIGARLQRNRLRHDHSAGIRVTMEWLS